MFRTLLSLLVFTVCVCGAATYEPNWESLQKHEHPEWFRDGKFGIYFHWGVYSVPAFGNEWYSHHMYNKGDRKGDAFYRHHRKTYGHPSEFGYKDFIKDFKAEHFDPDAWVALFKKAGAKFIGPVAEHADGFAMWDSALTQWDAMDMGPKRDIVGEMEQAVRKQGLKFVTTFHHQWLWAWYPTWDDNYDASNLEYTDLYGPILEQNEFRNPNPDDAFCERWLSRVNEVVDKYQPDLVWFDNRCDNIKESYRQQMAAHYFNAAEEWGRKVAITAKDREFPEGVGIIDIERGRMSELSEEIWLNDDSIDWESWCHVEPPHYKSTDRLIDGLVDIVSKNGNLLLNITPRADGTIPEPVKKRLLEIGKWLEINGEAIYGSRPWVVFGEGPTEVKEGRFNEKLIDEFTKKDIRFTTQGETIYAIALDWPKGKRLKIKSMGIRQEALGKVKKIELLGHPETFMFSRKKSGLTILDLPSKATGPYAHVFKITTEDTQ